MIELQVITKVIFEQNISPLIDGNISSDYFVTYAEEGKFLYEHNLKFGQVPSKETFINKFPEFEFSSTSESWEFLLNQLRESYMFSRLAVIMNSTAPLIEENAMNGYQILKQKIFDLESIRPSNGMDLIKDADLRLTQYRNRINDPNAYYIPIGLPEMDSKLGGWRCGEELVTMVARTNKGKTWILLEFLMQAWKQGKRVGLYSGEMSAESIGYRFDSLLQHFSNSDLMRPTNDTNLENYQKYINELKEKSNCFKIITPKDLGHMANVNDIENFIRKYDLEIVGIDQFSLMDDYRAKKGDMPRIRLGNISADLFNLSLKYSIPILALSQANRNASKKGAPDLEDISESDAIGQNSSRVITLDRQGNELTLSVKKNRYGQVGEGFVYMWDIDIGNFKFSRYEDEEQDTSSKQTRERIYQRKEESPF